jgi:hypothetical protein
VRIPTTDEMTKIGLSQKKSAFRNPFTVDDFGLENGNNMVRISLLSGNSSGARFLHYPSPRYQAYPHKTTSTILENGGIHPIGHFLPDVCPKNNHF